MKRKHRVVPAIAIITLTFAPQIARAAQYTVTTFSHSATNIASGLTAINASGDIAGTTTDNLDGSATGETPAVQIPFVAMGGTLIPLDNTHPIYGIPYAINDFGQTTGLYNTVKNQNFNNVFISSNGVLTDLGNLGAPVGSFVTGINNAGQLVGSSVLASGANYTVHAYYYNGTRQDLGTLGGKNSYAYGISNHRQVVGESNILGNAHSHAFSFAGGIMTDLGTLPGTTDSAANAVNDAGIIVGSSTHAFRYANGVMTDLGVLPGGIRSSALALNNLGDIVGLSTTTTSPFDAGHGFLVHNGVMTDLSNMINPALHLTILSATGINDHGQIVGVASDGVTQTIRTGILLTPNVTISGTPGAPTGLVAGTISSSKIDLRWFPVLGATSYSIYRSETPTGPRTLLGTISDTTNFRDVTAKDQATSYYVVIAANNAGTGPVSSQVSATTPLAIPAIPTNVKAVGINSSQIQISWNAVPKAAGYQVFEYVDTFEPGHGDTFSYVLIGTTTTTSLRAIGLQSSTTHTYAVSAYNATGQSEMSNNVNGTVLGGIPGPITTITAGGQSASQVLITWTAVPGATRYKVFGGSAHTIEQLYLGTVLTGTTYTHTNLQPLTSYYYYVIPVNSYGDGPKSQIASAQTWIAAPTNVVATAVNASQIDLHWSAVTGAAGYKIYISSVYGSAVASTNSNTLSYSKTGLNSATPYYFIVSANDNGVEESKSPAVTATTKSGIPGTPGLTVTSDTYSTVTLNWSVAPGATSYRVYRATAPNTPHISVGTTTTTHFTDTGLNGGTTYYYVVTATNTFGTSPKSNEVQTQTSTLPDAPTNVKAAAVSKSQINLTWTAAAGATSYIVFRGTTQGGLHSYVATTTATSYHDTQRTPNTTYYYIIVGVNASGQGPKSAEAAAKTSVQ